MQTFRAIPNPNNKKIEIANAGLNDALTRGFRQGAYVSGKLLTEDLRRDMAGSKSGRLYRVYKGIGGKLLKKSRQHRASSEKETPGIITGNYRRSVDFLVRGNQSLEFGAGANGFAEKYARILEEGSSKMEARKPIKRTVDKLQNQVTSNLTKYVNNNIKGLGFNVKTIKN